jgi:hypothetical protein
LPLLSGISFTASILIPALLAIFAGLLWWITRKKQQRHWLPILRVLPIKKHIIFRRVIAPPPWLAWIVFLLLATILVILSAKPYLEHPLDIAVKRQKAVFLIDLSDSVFVHVNDSEYMSVLRERAAQYESVMYVAADSTMQAWNRFSLAEQRQLQNNQRFVDYFPQDLKSLGEFDELVVFSDKDVYTWQGFHYLLIAKKIRLEVVDLGRKEQPKNIYISRLLADQMEVRRVGPIYEATLVDEKDRRIQVQFSQSSDTLLVDRLYGRVRIEADDDLKEDNEVDLPALALKPHLDLVAPVLSERLIDEPVYHLAKIFEAQGLSVSLHEKAPKDFTALVSYGLCAPSTKQAQMMWFIPAMDHYQSLCECTISNVGSSFAGCDEVQSRQDFVSLANSIGLKQVGGVAGEVEQAVAFRKEHMLFFTIDPAAVWGVSRFALTMRELLRSEGILQEASTLFTPPIPLGESELKRREIEVAAQDLKDSEKDSTALVVPLVAAMLVLLAVDSAVAMWIVVLCLFIFSPLQAQTHLHLISPYERSLAPLSRMVESRTSIDFRPELKISADLKDVPWLWLRRGELQSFAKKAELHAWLLKGGLLVMESAQQLDGLEWQDVALGHELMQSYYLLKQLPTCNELPWRVASKADGQIVALSIPFAFLDAVLDTPPCEMKKEDLNRSFVNLLMVALTLDYKKDQIHLPEILKRIR